MFFLKLLRLYVFIVGNMFLQLVVCFIVGSGFVFLEIDNGFVFNVLVVILCSCNLIMVLCFSVIYRW